MMSGWYNPGSYTGPGYTGGFQSPSSIQYPGGMAPGFNQGGSTPYQPTSGYIQGGSPMGGMAPGFNQGGSIPPSWFTGLMNGQTPNPMAPSGSFPMLGMWPGMGYGAPFGGGLFGGSSGSLGTAGGPPSMGSTGRFHSVSGTGQANTGASGTYASPYRGIDQAYYRQSYRPNYIRDAALQRQGLSPGPQVRPGYAAPGLTDGPTNMAPWQVDYGDPSRMPMIGGSMAGGM
jgi:hypothetical protein